MTSPELAHAASQTRTEEKVRELAKSYKCAEALYNQILHTSRANMTEDEEVDNLIALALARKAMGDAYCAFHASIQATQ